MKAPGVDGVLMSICLAVAQQFSNSAVAMTSSERPQKCFFLSEMMVVLCLDVFSQMVETERRDESRERKATALADTLLVFESEYTGKARQRDAVLYCNLSWTLIDL